MPELVRLRPGELPGREALRRAADAAASGQIVAFPTDTVYGLGTSALSREGVARIFRMKGRSPDKPLPLLAASAEAARRWVEWTPSAEALARRFWPGGLTLVLKASAEGRALANVQGQTVAVRVPDHPVALALLEASQAPWAQTSANASTEPPLADGQEAARRFAADLAIAFDCGPAPGKESTVVDASSGSLRLLREGQIPASAILPRRFLFVCTGNTCRSVMAEFLLRKLAPELEARSAGVAADPAFAVPPAVRAVLREQGIASVEHRPTPVSRELLDWADLVLVMELRHRETLLGLFPGSAGKIETLAGQDISDPVGSPEPVYAACGREIRQSLEVLLERYVPHPHEARP